MHQPMEPRPVVEVRVLKNKNREIELGIAGMHEYEFVSMEREFRNYRHLQSIKDKVSTIPHEDAAVSYAKDAVKVLVLDYFDRGSFVRKASG